jgi:hypothetical protein
MRILVRLYSRSDWHGSAPVAPPTFADLLHTAWALLHGAVTPYVIEYRRAKAAQELCRRLSSLSGAELDRRGLERRRLPQLVRDCCYPGL